MFHQQWLQLIQSALGEIKTQYPHCTLNEKNNWRNRLQQIKKSCDHMLESWALIDEEISCLLTEHPDLLVNENQKTEEEMWLDSSVVRQFRQGQGYYDLTMFEKAKKSFTQVIEEEPEFLLGRIYLGLSEFQENRLEESRHHFQLICSIATQEAFTAFAHHMIGCIFVKQKDDWTAIKQFNKVISLQSDYYDSWFNLGTCYYRLGKFQKAIPYFYHALSLNEDDWESMYYLSNCYRYCQEWENVTFWRFLTLEKTNHPRIMESIAHDYEEMGNYKEALNWYQKLLTYDQLNPICYHGIAWNLWALQQWDSALLWIKKGLALFPNHSDILFTYIWMIMLKGDLQKAKLAFHALPASLTKQPLWLAMFSRLAAQLGDCKQAIKIADYLIQQEKSFIQSVGHYQKGKIYLEMKKNATKAIYHFQKSHQLVTHWKEPLFFEGLCHMIEGRLDSTKSCWEQISFMGV